MILHVHRVVLFVDEADAFLRKRSEVSLNLTVGFFSHWKDKLSSYFSFSLLQIIPVTLFSLYAIYCL